MEEQKQTSESTSSNVKPDLPPPSNDKDLRRQAAVLVHLADSAKLKDWIELGGPTAIETRSKVALYEILSLLQSNARWGPHVSRPNWADHGKLRSLIRSSLQIDLFGRKQLEKFASEFFNEFSKSTYFKNLNDEDITTSYQPFQSELLKK